MRVFSIKVSMNEDYFIRDMVIHLLFIDDTLYRLSENWNMHNTKIRVEKYETKLIK